MSCADDSIDICSIREQCGFDFADDTVHAINELGELEISLDRLKDSAIVLWMHFAPLKCEILLPEVASTKQNFVVV